MSALEVGPRGPRQVSPGEVLEVYIYSSEVEVPNEDLAQYKNQRIGDRLYVLNVDKDNRVLKVIVTKEGKPDNKKEDGQAEQVVTYRNLTFLKAESPSIPSYFTVESGNKFEVVKNLPILGSVLLLILLALLARPILRKLKKAKEAKREKNELLNLVQTAEKRKGFELIYAKRKRLQEVFKLHPDDLIEFENTLNKYQYSPEWDEQALGEVKKSYQKLLEVLRI